MRICSLTVDASHASHVVVTAVGDDGRAYAQVLEHCTLEDVLSGRARIAEGDIGAWPSQLIPVTPLAADELPAPSTDQPLVG